MPTAPLPAGNRCQQGRTADGPGAHRYGVAGPRQHGAVAGGVLPGNRLPKSLGFTVGGLRFRVVHGGVDVINRFLFRSGRAAIAAELARAGSDIVIAGHCGIPFIARAGGRVWFNPGVIGMPANDGTTDTRFGLIEAGRDHLTLSTHRLAYDHASAAAAMRRWGHTDGYARSLITGLWPSLDVLPAPEKAATGRRIRPSSLRIERAGEGFAAARP